MGEKENHVTLLAEGLIRLGIDGEEGGRIHSALNRYIEEIELFNPAYGLVKVRDRQELIVKHILDSLAPINVIRRLLDEKAAGLQPAACQVADVGSGAGLPGIPLAICIGEDEFTLIERMGRRAGFLRNALAVLGLANVMVAEAEMEKVSTPPGFDLIVFRAFRPLGGGIIKALLRLLKPGGTIAAYKGKRQAVEEEIGRAAFPREISREIIPLEVPFLDEERHLLLIRATAFSE
jgi:16S rRNA (guanine527-N7)-methyltransferase